MDITEHVKFICGFKYINIFKFVIKYLILIYINNAII